MSMKPSLTARCRSPKGAGALGSSFIGESYTDFNRHRDHAHSLPTSAPMTYAEPHAEPEPMNPRAVTPETPKHRAARAGGQWLAEFRSLVNPIAAPATSRVRAHFMAVNTNLHPAPAKAGWEIDMAAGAERHRLFIEGEKAANAARRAARS